MYFNPLQIISKPLFTFFEEGNRLINERMGKGKTDFIVTWVGLTSVTHRSYPFVTLGKDANKKDNGIPEVLLRISTMLYSVFWQHGRGAQKNHEYSIARTNMFPV